MSELVYPQLQKIPHKDGLTYTYFTISPVFLLLNEMHSPIMIIAHTCQQCAPVVLCFTSTFN